MTEFFQKNAPTSFNCWKVVRKGFVGNVGIVGHATESHDIKGDYTPTNDSTFEELYEQIELGLQGIKTRETD